AVGVGPHLPVGLVPRQWGGAVATEVPVDARCPSVGARHAIGQGDVPRDHADATRALLEDLVAHEQLFDLVAETAGPLHGAAALVDPPLGQVVLDAADAVEVGMEAASGSCFD